MNKLYLRFSIVRRQARKSMSTIHAHTLTISENIMASHNKDYSRRIKRRIRKINPGKK
jgi:hypothetical protein